VVATWGLTTAVAALALVIGIWLALRALRSQRVLVQALLQERARTQCIEPLLDVWLWQTDRQHRIVSMRPPAGAPSAEWATTQLQAPIWEQLMADDPAALRAQLESAAPLDDIPVRRTAADGSARRLVLRARMHADAQGRFAGYHGTLQDLADTAAGALPAPAVAALFSAARLEETAATPAADHESFSFTVSHDLRAPIRVVEGFTKIVKEDYGRLLDRVGNDHLDRVLGAAARMNNMIDALLALSKLSSQPLARQPVNLTQLAGYVADDLRRQWPERQIAIHIEPDMQVQGDPTLLRVVIENLLGNAWKYTGKSAQAAIAFTRDATRPDAFSVRDNGAGFDMRFSDRLFGVFQRLHSANDFPGTGIGLASVRRIVRRHGGEIWGEAEVNSGATFFFTLPQR
jgi:signal transduction histidine kinase